MGTIISYFQSGDITGLLLYILYILLAMCIAISFHEWAHAFVAYKLGDPTAKNMGRMTLDPLKHLDPWGFLCFIIFRIGFAKPVIVNSRNLKHFRRDDILISLAGPLTNLVLSFIFYGILFFCVYAGVNDYVTDALSYIVMLNVSFAIFNVLPIPPLDGFHVISSLFVRKSYKVVDILNRYGFIILIAICFTGILDTVLDVTANGLFDLYNSFFSLFI